MNSKWQETAYILYTCNLHKERDSMRAVTVAGNMDTLYAVIGTYILNGEMDYRGYSKLKGFEMFREDCRNEEFTSAHLDYGYIEDHPVAVMGSEMSQQWKTAYEWLNMTDAEYEAHRDGTALKGIETDRLRQILDRALRSAANDYRGAELYDFLHETLEMKDTEIHKAGFDLEEFYADPDECVGSWYEDEQEDEEDAEL